MHYTGMSAMRMAAVIRYDPFWVTLSIAIAIGASIVALWLAFHTTSVVQRAFAGIVMGAAVSGMHYAAMQGSSFILTGAFGLVIAQTIQTVLLGGWLVWRDLPVVKRTLQLLRPSLFAGFMGAAASAGWFTAFAIEPAAHVRTLALIELLFSYMVSRKIFREKLTRLELAGIALLTVGLAVVTLAR